MKKLSLILILVLFPTFCFASPFLVCDTQPDTDEYVLVFDGVEEIVPYNDAGGYVILKDLVGISESNHEVSLKARNIWGESSAVPFSFVKELPGISTGIGLKK